MYYASHITMLNAKPLITFFKVIANSLLQSTDPGRCVSRKTVLVA